MNPVPQSSPLSIPLPALAHQLAQDCSEFLCEPQRAKQTYLNTLALYAVDHYLQWIGFETHWPESDSRNPIVLQFMDVADLQVNQCGRLECRALLPEADVCEVPPDAWDDRIGYMVVRLNAQLTEAKLLGFMPDAGSQLGKLAVKNLHSLETLPSYLNRMTQAQNLPQLGAIQLTQWFHNRFEQGWQQCLSLLEPTTGEPTLCFRGGQGVMAAKPVNLTPPLSDYSMDLRLKLTPKSDGCTRIEAQLTPQYNTSLPNNLKLSVIDEEGDTLIEVFSHHRDPVITLRPFTGKAGEQFTLDIHCQGSCFQERFVI